MAQWGKTDNANSSPSWGPELFNKKANSANRTALFGNTTANAFISGATVKVVGVTDAEMANSGGSIAHTGWVKYITGTGGRAGRVQTEVLVAGGMAEAAALVTITIGTQPASKSVAGNTATTFTVVATTSPNTAMTYQWKGDSGSGFVTLTNSGVYSNTTTATLSISNTAGLDGIGYQVVVSAVGANTAYSATAVLTVT